MKILPKIFESDLVNTLFVRRNIYTSLVVLIKFVFRICNKMPEFEII